MTLPATLPIPEDALDIARTLEAAGHEVWCVGGAIRDALLGPALGVVSLSPADIDFTTSARPEEVQALFGRKRTVDVGSEHGTIGVLDRQRVLHEVTTFRRDVTTDGRRAVVEFGASIEEDLARRDFTINAIAYQPFRHEWKDPFGGAADLAQGVVRAVGAPDQRFREDYLRILRALRFAARFGFRIDPPTWDAARAAASGLTQLSAERVRDELFKGLRTARDVSQLGDLWRDVGASAIWLPELVKPAFPKGSFSVIEVNRFPRDPVLLVMLLCRNPGAVLRRLKARNVEIARAEAVNRAPAEPSDETVVTVRRWLSAAAQSADDLLALWRLRTGADAPWAGTVAQIRRSGDPLTRADLALDGDDLIALGVERGPAVGTMLDRLLDRVLADPSLNTAERLTALVEELA
jgi:tRNA nucleotidyltransferase (CCA-adding enzyme)